MIVSLCLIIAAIVMLGVVPAFAETDGSGDVPTEEPSPDPSPDPTPDPDPEPEPEPDPVDYQDIDADHWAAAAVAYTAEERDWLRFGTTHFRPGRALQRWQLARAAVRAFAPEAALAPDVTFTDLTGGKKYRYANVAVSLGWFPASDAFNPTGTVSKRLLNRVIVRALGLADEARSLDRIRTEDGSRLKTPKSFGYLVLGNELALNYNFSSPEDGKDLYPWQKVRRDYAAASFHRAATAGWRLWTARSFSDITLPAMNRKRRTIVQFAFRYVGWPYVWGGEWHTAAGQPKGGYDWSGFQWWVAKRPDASFDNTAYRPYRGWQIGQRRASLIAKEAAKEDRLRYRALRPGDLVFFETGSQGGTWRGIDHGGVALGNGWMIHSSGSRGGVTISNIGDASWWRDTFVMGRKLFD